MEDSDAGKLPVWPTVRAAIAQVLSDPVESARIASGPFTVALAAGVVQSFLAPSTVNDSPPSPSAVTALLVALVSAAAQLSFWVAWIRFVLLRDSADRRWFAFTFGMRELKFLFQLIKVGLVVAVIVAIAFAPFGFVSFLAGHGPFSIAMLATGGILVVCMAIYSSIRLSFVTTAAAVDSLPGLKRSFDQTRGYFWRLAAILWLAGTIIGIPALLIALAVGIRPYGDHSQFNQPVGWVLIETLLAYLSSAIVNGSQAIVFREATNWPTDALASR